MEEETILLIAQISSMITCIVGLMSIYYTRKAASGLLSGEFRDIIIRSSFFLTLVMIGVISMTYYHAAYDNELAEKIWYSFMFVSLLYSFYESFKIMEFGKPFLSLKKIGKSKKKKN